MPQLIEYFSAEKQESLLFMLAGFAAIAVSAWLWKTGNDYRAMGFPLVAIAVIQIVVGASVYFRTDAQVADLQTQYEASPTAMAEAEIPRMQTVIKNFKTYKVIEIILLLTGIGITLYTTAWTPYAIGVGLIAQSSIMLVLDLFAEKRAEVYMNWLQGLT